MRKHVAKIAWLASGVKFKKQSNLLDKDNINGDIIEDKCLNCFSFNNSSRCLSENNVGNNTP